ncbi:hypothetical protein M501DRAFT_1002605 [Patellaria atrata CBS 101060]|uniref:MARVEL domain-containing protein n=1 Tax=Patellaria atrata CBS 101060 TaxID=1346257 RepID=A0A9P4VSB8_9PEZI|nr:hypothetical protein M501DRAFT_1002605 [Patellaria atrata CBS 101060]
MAFNFTLPLRIVQILFSVIVLGLLAYVANWWNQFWWTSSPSEINFLIFCSIWTLLALVYLIIAPWKFPVAAHKFAILGVEVVTMIFWFAGFIALAAFLGNGRECRGSVCNSARAGVAFAAFEWLLFTATTVMAVLHVYRTRNTHNNEPPAEMQVPTTTTTPKVG